MGCQLCASKQTVQTVKKDSQKSENFHESNSRTKNNNEKLTNAEWENLRPEPAIHSSHMVEVKQEENNEKLILESAEVNDKLKFQTEDLENEGENFGNDDEKSNHALLVDQGDSDKAPVGLDDLNYESFDKIILLIGDSGSGKSSLINLIHNHLSNHRSLNSIEIVSPTEKWDFSPDCESFIISSGFNLPESPAFTKEIRLVHLKNKQKNKEYLFIDTPGFIRTDEDPDKKTTSLILSLISQVPRLDLVLYVHRATVTKFESSLKATLAEFHPVIESCNSKVIAIYSFAGSKLDVKHDSLPFSRSSVQKKYHAINNLTFSQTRADLEDKKQKKGNQGTYEQTLNKLQSFLDSL